MNLKGDDMKDNSMAIKVTPSGRVQPGETVTQFPIMVPDDLTLELIEIQTHQAAHMKLQASVMGLLTASGRELEQRQRDWWVRVFETFGIAPRNDLRAEITLKQAIVTDQPPV